MSKLKKKLAVLTGIIGLSLIGSPVQAAKYKIDHDLTDKIKVVNLYRDGELGHTTIEQTLVDGTIVTYQDYNVDGEFDLKQIERTDGNKKIFEEDVWNDGTIDRKMTETKYEDRIEKLDEIFDPSFGYSAHGSVEKILEDGTVKKESYVLFPVKKLVFITYEKKSGNGEMTEKLDLKADGTIDTVTEVTEILEGVWMKTNYRLDENGNPDFANKRTEYWYVKKSGNITKTKYDSNGDNIIDFIETITKTDNETKKEFDLDCDGKTDYTILETFVEIGI